LLQTTFVGGHFNASDNTSSVNHNAIDDFGSSDKNKVTTGATDQQSLSGRDIDQISAKVCWEALRSSLAVMLKLPLTIESVQSQPFVTVSRSIDEQDCDCDSDSDSGFKDDKEQEQQERESRKTTSSSPSLHLRSDSPNDTCMKDNQTSSRRNTGRCREKFSNTGGISRYGGEGADKNAVVISQYFPTESLCSDTLAAWIKLLPCKGKVR
jgi:hypothetical protein